MGEGRGGHGSYRHADRKYTSQHEHTQVDYRVGRGCSVVPKLLGSAPTLRVASLRRPVYKRKPHLCEERIYAEIVYHDNG